MTWEIESEEPAGQQADPWAVESESPAGKPKRDGIAGFFLSALDERNKAGIKDAKPAPAPKPAAPVAVEQAPFKDKGEAIRDAVDRIALGADTNKVLTAFAPLGVTREELEAEAKRQGIGGLDPAPVKGAKPIEASGTITRTKLSTTDGILNTLTRAKEGIGRTADVLLTEAGIGTKEALAGSIARRQRISAAATPDEETVQAMHGIQQAGEKGWMPALEAMAKNPVATLTMLTESALQSAPVGIAAGGAALVSGPFGAAAVAGGSSFAMEYANTLVDTLNDAGMNPNNPADVLKFLNNPELMKKARFSGFKRGISVGAFDAATAGLSGRFVKPVMEAAEAGRLGGKDLVRASLGAAGKESLLQMGGGAGGEATAQILDKGAITDRTGVIMEALAELPGGIAEVGGNVGHARKATPGYQFGKALEQDVAGTSFTQEGIDGYARASQSPDFYSPAAVNPATQAAQFAAERGAAAQRLASAPRIEDMPEAPLAPEQITALRDQVDRDKAAVYGQDEQPATPATPAAEQPPAAGPQPIGIAATPQGELAQRAEAALRQSAQEAAPPVQGAPAAQPQTFATRGEAMVHAVNNRMTGVQPMPVDGRPDSWTLQPAGQQLPATREKQATLDELLPQQTSEDVARDSAGIARLNGEYASQGITVRGAPVQVRPAKVVRPELRAAQAAAQALGVRVVAVDGLPTAGAAYFDQGGPVAYVGANSSASEVVVMTAGHEALHVLRMDAPELYDRYVAAITPTLKRGAVAKRQRFENANLNEGEAPASREYAHEEVMADVSGAMWLDEGMWRRVIELDPHLFRRLAYRFMANMSRMLTALKDSRQDVTQLVTDVQHVREMTARLWAEKASGKQLVPGEREPAAKPGAAIKASRTDNPEERFRDLDPKDKAAGFPGEDAFARMETITDEDYGPIGKTWDDGKGKYLKEDIDEEDLQRELDMEQAGPQAPARATSFARVTPDKVRGAGLFMEDAYPELAYKENENGGMSVRLRDGPMGEFRISGYGLDQYRAVPGMQYGDKGSALPLNGVSRQLAEAYNQRIAASFDLEEQGFDLARQVSKHAAQRVLKVWDAIKAMPGSFEYAASQPAPSSQKQSGKFGRPAQVARAQEVVNELLAGKDVQFEVKPVFYAGEQAIALATPQMETWDDDELPTIQLYSSGSKPVFVLHSSELKKGSGVGKAFYQAAAAIVRDLGGTVMADPSGLTGVNTYRRTEQMVSDALRADGASTVQPGAGQRIYGWEEGASKKAKKDNLLRLLLASARNAKEIVSFADRLRYDIEANRFTIAGRDAEGQVADALKSIDARAVSLSRSTLARAALTFEALEGEVRIPENAKPARPLLYSREEQSYTSLDDDKADGYKRFNGRELALEVGTDGGDVTIRVDAGAMMRDLQARQDVMHDLINCLS